MRSSTFTLALRSLALAGISTAFAPAPASGQVTNAHAIGDTSHALPQDGPLGGPIGAYPRVSALSPVDDGWVTQAGGLTGFDIHFDRPVDFPLSAVRAYLTPGVEITGLQLIPNADNTVYSVSLSGPPITLDRVRFVLDAASITSAGLPLDGEISNPVLPAFPSGDGRAGGQAVFLFNVIAGDANRDGVVDASDADMIIAAIGAAQGDPNYNPLADFNRDGYINVLDVAAWSMGNGDALPVRDGTPPTATLVSPDPSLPLPTGADTLIYEFTEPVAPQGITTGSLAIVDAFGALGTVDAVNVVSPTTVEFRLDAPLVPDLSYSATVSNAIADLSGELLPLNKETFSFAPPSNTSIFPPRTFPVGFGPEYAANGDMNNDGETDFVVSNAADGTMSVLLGNGDGTFLPQIVSFAGNTPRGFALGDFDADGNLDAAVSLEGEGAVAVLYGDGAGNLGLGASDSTFAVTGASPVAVASGFLDNDLIPDLAIVNSGSQTVSILLPRTDRTLGIAPDITVPGVPSSAAIGELSGDALLDLAVTNEVGNTVTIFAGFGDGTFAVLARGGGVLPTGDAPVFVGIGDLDNDKDFDLYTANKGGGSTTVFTNFGFTRGAGFGAQEISVGDGAVFVGIGDLDNDKDLDLATADRAGDSVTPVKQGPAGNYASDPAIDSGDAPVYAAIVDVNNDGETDVVTVLSRDGSARRGALVVRLGGANEDIEGQRQFDAPPEPTHIVLADIDSTAAIDMIIAGAGQGSDPEIRVLEGSGDGEFTQGASVLLPATPRDLAVANVVDESRRDVIVSLGDKLSETRVYSNSSKGLNFAETLPFTSRVTVGNMLPGFPGTEIVTAPSSGAEVSAISVYNLFGFRRGSIQPIVTADVFGGVVGDVAVADFNDDGLLDIAAVGYGGIFADAVISRGISDAGLVVFYAESLEGEIEYTSSIRVDLPDDHNFISMDTGDVNGDSLPDVVVCANIFTSFRGEFASVGAFSVIASDEQSVFAEAEEYFIGRRVGGVELKDFTNDELADVAITSVFDDEVAVFVSASGGGFFEPQFYETHVAPGDLCATDVNGDGAMDLAIVNTGSDDVTLLLGQGTPIGPDDADELEIDLGSLTVQAISTGRGGSFGLEFTGGIIIEDDGDSVFADLLLDAVSADPNAELVDFVGSIAFIGGQVMGGAFAATVAESDERGVGFTVYSATLAKGSGQIAFVTGEGFQVTGVTVSNLFSSSNLAGIDISDWTEEGPLSGSFFLTGFEPDGAGFDPDVDLDLTVAEPTAIEAR